MASNKASKDDLNLLHTLTAKMCLDILQNGVWIKDDEGIARQITPSASLLAVVTKFLKDNNITDDGQPAPNAGRDLAAAARNLPEFDSDEDSRPIN